MVTKRDEPREPALPENTNARFGQPVGEAPRSGGTPAAAPALIAEARKDAAWHIVQADGLPPRYCLMAEFHRHYASTLTRLADALEAGALSGVAPEPSEAAIEAALSAIPTFADMNSARELRPTLVLALRAAYAIDGAAVRGSAGAQKSGEAQNDTLGATGEDTRAPGGSATPPADGGVASAHSRGAGSPAPSPTESDAAFRWAVEEVCAWVERMVNQGDAAFIDGPALMAMVRRLRSVRERAPAVPSPAPPADNLNTKCPCCNAPAAMYLDGVPRESFIGHFNHAVVTYRYTPVPVGAPSEAAPPDGPWKVITESSLATTLPQSPNHYVGKSGITAGSMRYAGPFTKAEALVVRDALNRVVGVSGGAPATP